MQKTKQKQDIPRGWQRVKLGDISRLRKGLTYKSSHYSNEQDGLIFLTLKSIQRGGGFNTEGVKYYAGDFDKNAVVKEDDLVIANTDITRNAEVVGAPMLLPKLVKEPALISMDLSVVDIEDGKADNHYLYYLLQTPAARNFMRDHSSGSTVLHLKTKDVPNFDLTIPPLQEQKKIAEILGAVDKEIQKTDEIISATEKLKRGLMQKLLVQGNGISTTLENIGEFKRGPFGGALKKEIFVADGYKVYEQKNAIYNDFSLGSYFIDSEKFEQMKGFELRSGDILISCSGTLGKVAVVPQHSKKGIINQALLKITPSKEWDVLYVKYLLEAEYIQNRFVKVAPGSAMKNMASMLTIKSTKVTKPKFKEQQKIANILSSVDEKISINQKLKDKLTLLKKGLMQDLLSGSKRVNV